MNKWCATITTCQLIRLEGFHSLVELTHPVKGIPGNNIVPNHTTDQADLQIGLLHHLHDTGMDSIPVAFYWAVLAVES